MFHINNPMGNKKLISKSFGYAYFNERGKPLLTLWHCIMYHQVKWNNAFIHMGLNVARHDFTMI